MIALWSVRQEILESLKIIQQALDNMPEGKHFADVPEFYLPPKEDVYTKHGSAYLAFQNRHG